MIDWTVVYLYENYLMYKRCNSEEQVRDFIEACMGGADIEKTYVIHGNDVYSVRIKVELISEGK